MRDHHSATDDDGTPYLIHAHYADEPSVLEVHDSGESLETSWSWDEFTVAQVRAYAHALLAACSARETSATAP